jgi:predicted nuclease of predicted toxin-antitoxin system
VAAYSLLCEHFGECVHVNKTGLPMPAKDVEIWDYAAQNNCIIVTQDSDFLHLLEAKGHPPKVVLLRIGNMSMKETGMVLAQAKYSIADLYQNDYGLLEILADNG